MGVATVVCFSSKKFAQAVHKLEQKGVFTKFSGLALSAHVSVDMNTLRATMQKKKTVGRKGVRLDNEDHKFLKAMKIKID